MGTTVWLSNSPLATEDKPRSEKTETEIGTRNERPTEEPEKTSINIAISHRRTRQNAKNADQHSRGKTSFLVQHRKTTANLRTKRKPSTLLPSFYKYYLNISPPLCTVPFPLL